MKAIAFSVALLAASCPPAPVPIPDAGDSGIDAGDVYDQACSTLERVGCKSGQSSCSVVMRNADPTIPQNPTCVAKCTSQACVKSCGVSCN